MKPISRPTRLNISLLPRVFLGNGNLPWWGIRETREKKRCLKKVIFLYLRSWLMKNCLRHYTECPPKNGTWLLKIMCKSCRNFNNQVSFLWDTRYEIETILNNRPLTFTIRNIKSLDIWSTPEFNRWYRTTYHLHSQFFTSTSTIFSNNSGNDGALNMSLNTGNLFKFTVGYLEGNPGVLGGNPCKIYFGNVSLLFDRITWLFPKIIHQN